MFQRDASFSYLYSRPRCERFAYNAEFNNPDFTAFLLSLFLNCNDVELRWLKYERIEQTSC